MLDDRLVKRRQRQAMLLAIGSILFLAVTALVRFW
jgi:hypothetical protein